ncbi:MAG: hypothetical protein K2P04_10325, partial [Oscillospiraceae bacterium]|nr:hypothetical protein [Oscillospiraceae bacterium]
CTFLSLVILLLFPELEVSTFFVPHHYDEWKGKREDFERAHVGELRTFHMTRRKLDKHRSPAGKIPVHAWEQEQARLHQKYTAEYEQYKPIQDDLRRLQQVKRNADVAIRQQEQTRQKRR